MEKKNEKTLYIKYYLDDTDYELDKVKKEDTISKIKERVEDLLGIKLVRVIIKKSKKTNPIVLELDKTVQDYHLHSGDTIIVGRTEVHGGVTI
jgi:hypothetical protein